VQCARINLPAGKRLRRSGPLERAARSIWPRTRDAYDVLAAQVEERRAALRGSRIDRDVHLQDGARHSHCGPNAALNKRWREPNTFPIGPIALLVA